METNVLGSHGRQVLRKIWCLIFVIFLSCVLNTQYAAALTLDKAAPGELPTTSYSGFAEVNATRISVPRQQADGKQLVWSFYAGYMLEVALGSMVDRDKPPQLFFGRGRTPNFAVRIERQF